ICRIIEIPETDQARFATDESRAHSCENLLRRTLSVPHTHFVEGAFEIGWEIVGGHPLAEVESLAVSQAGETASVVSRAHEHAIEIKFHPTRTGNSGHVTPLL